MGVMETVTVTDGEVVTETDVDVVTVTVGLLDGDSVGHAVRVDRGKNASMQFCVNDAAEYFDDSDAGTVPVR